MTRDSAGDDVTNRMSQRFENTDDTPDNPEKTDTTDMQTQPDTADTPKETEQQDEIDPKEEWTGRNIYVPDDDPDLLEAFDGEFDRLQYECDWQIRKQTHYYPVLIRVGVDELQEMDGDEFTACVEDLNLR